MPFVTNSAMFLVLYNFLVNMKERCGIIEFFLFPLSTGVVATYIQLIYISFSEIRCL